MVIHNLYIRDASVAPSEANPPFNVHAKAVLAILVFLQRSSRLVGGNVNRYISPQGNLWLAGGGADQRGVIYLLAFAKQIPASALAVFDLYGRHNPLSVLISAIKSPIAVSAIPLYTPRICLFWSISNSFSVCRKSPAASGLPMSSLAK